MNNTNELILSKKELNKLSKKEAKNKLKDTKIEDVPVDYSSHLYGGPKENRDLKICSIDNINAGRIGSILKIRGRLQVVRKTGKQAFLMIREAYATIQCIAYSDTVISPAMIKFIGNIPKESVVEVIGKVAGVEKPVESCSQSLVEIQVQQIYVVSRANQRLMLQYEDAIRPESGDDTMPRVNLDTRLDNRHLDLRTTTNMAIFTIRSAVKMLFNNYLCSLGFINIDTPSMISAASEGGAGVFEIKYFDGKAFLAQSPQLYKQMAIIGDFKRVFINCPVFRAENSNTHRHLTEFNGLDLEMEINDDYHEVIHTLCDTLCHVFAELEKNYGREIAEVRKQYPSTQFVYSYPPLIIDYSEGIELIRSTGIVHGDCEDLSTANEKLLGRLIKKKYGTDFFVLDKFPLAVRPFYTMPDKAGSKYSRSYDMFMRGEEILSGAQRIHDATELRASAVSHNIDTTTIEAYLGAFEDACPPHGGGGIGLERVVMLYLGLSNIRLASMFPRDPKRLTP